MIPRLRIIAGPNGSGKSTLAQKLTDDYAVNLYHFLNADLLLAEILKQEKTPCPFSIDSETLLDFVRQSTYPEQYKKPFLQGKIQIEPEDYLTFARDSINSYTVAMVADFLKEQYLNRQLSFSFETVFSHPAKLDLLKKAQASGFRTYLYFVATETPKINLNRIQIRVALGGHDVPPDKVEARYERCLAQIKDALPCLNRAYFFDNSSSQLLYLAEYNSTSGFLLHSENLPQWFKRYALTE